MRLKNIKKFLKVNRANGRKFVMCRTQVDKNAVSRVTIGGAEHIIITSKTLPDNIVMNGGLYPAEEIEASFKSLERTLAPVEHPVDTDGNFISASDPIAIHEFHAGAFNTNVRRENGRVSIDKMINVQEAMKSDKGKRLLDRVEELETNSDPRPIHTSVGVFLEVEFLDSPKTNALGQDYEWIAREMVFDHDAILLDSVAAAQPHQGVGIAVNGDKFNADQIELDIPIKVSEMSHTEIRDSIERTLTESPFDNGFVSDIIGDSVIFHSGDSLFRASFKITDGVAEIIGVPEEVTRSVTFIPVTNDEGDTMKELILNALKKAGVETDGLDDDQLLVEYNALQTNQNSDDEGEASDNTVDIASVVTNALKPLSLKLESLEAKIGAEDASKLNEMAELVGNSDKYPDISVEDAKAIPVATLSKMAANCQTSFGIPLTVVGNQSGEENLNMTMPE